MKIATKYWHTLRPLRPVQFYGRVWFRLRRPQPDLRPAPDLRLPQGKWRAQVERPVSMTGEYDFCFLNKCAEVREPEDWNDPDKEKLWLYNLHYFDDLNAAKTANKKGWHKELMARWVAENPPGHGNGWEPYPLSLRIVNWIKWALRGNELTGDMKQSLAVQIRFLRARLEWHLLGNHLFANAKALLFAGLFFEGDEAAKWRAKGLEILAQEIPEQVLADGGHFELSPMYHAIILEDVLDMINLAGTCPGVIPGAVVEEWRSAADKMRVWQLVMQHPDGRICFFNDAAFGIAADPKELEAYAERLALPPCAPPKEGITHLSQSGYVRVEQDELVALLDVARIGPDYLPGHAHADTLSFELSLFGQRLFVNSGTSQYGADQERLRQRSTAAHNTLELNGENSSEVWGGFRVARRARPLDLTMDERLATAERAGELVIHCGHDGYQRLPGKPRHNRVWSFTPGMLAIFDMIEGGVDNKVVIYYHLHPDIKVVGGAHEGHFGMMSGESVQWRVKGGQARIRAGTWHPEFGRSQPNQVLEVTMTAPDCAISISW